MIKAYLPNIKLDPDMEEGRLIHLNWIQYYYIGTLTIVNIGSRQKLFTELIKPVTK